MTDDHPGVIMPPPFIVLIALGIGIVLEWIVGLSFLPPISFISWSVYLGIAAVAAGIGLEAWALRTFRSVGTNPLPFQPSTAIATGGPYRFTRNPMYLGMLLILAGLSLAVSLEWGLILTPAAALVLHYGVVLREERYLSTKFGQVYRDFLARTRRWI